MQFVGSLSSWTKETLDDSVETSTSKRRKTCTEDLDGEHVNVDESNDAAANNSEEKSGNFMVIITQHHAGVLSNPLQWRQFDAFGDIPDISF